MDKQLASDNESSEEPMSSEKSLLDSESTTTHVKPRLVKSDSNAVIDKKMLVKFNSLIKTLKETRSNLVTVDQIISRDKRRLRSNKSESSLQELSTQFRRASSLPPLLRLPDCHLCRGDSCQDQYFQSTNHSADSDIFKNDLKIGLGRTCRSMQDLTTISLNPEQNNEQMGDSHKKSDQELFLDFSAKDSESSARFLRHQLEDREKQITELSYRLQELTNKLKVSEGHRHQLIMRMEDLMYSPLEVQTEAERLATEVKRIEDLASEAQLEKNRLKRRARKIVQELKEKCKHYSAELQRAKDREWELDQRCNKHAHENSVLLSQISNITEKFQNIFQELDKIKVNSHSLQNDLQKKDLEIMETKARNQELIQKLDDNKNLKQKCLDDYDELRNKIEKLLEEKLKLETWLAASNKELEMSKETIRELKEEIKELQAKNSEVNAQLLAETTIRQAVETSTQEMTEKLRNMEKRLAEIQDKYLDAVNDHGKEKDTLQQEMISQKISEEQKLQDALKKQQALFESRFTTFKLELAENQAEARTLQDALKKEMDTKAYLKSEISRCKDEFQVLDHKYRQLCKYYLVKKKKLQGKELKIRNLQQKLLEVHDMGKCLEDDFQDILKLIHDDIDTASSLLLNKHSDYPVLTTEDDPSLHLGVWLKGIKNKLHWLTNVIEKLTTGNEGNLPQHSVSVDNIHKLPSHSSSVKKTNSDTTHIDRWKKNYSELSMHYPFNSTEVREMINSGCENNHGLMIFKRYQRFRQLFESIQDDISRKSSVQPDVHEESSETCLLSTGQISPSSSLSSISVFSCEMPETCNK